MKKLPTIRSFQAWIVLLLLSCVEFLNGGMADPMNRQPVQQTESDNNIFSKTLGDFNPPIIDQPEGDSNTNTAPSPLSTFSVMLPSGPSYPSLKSPLVMLSALGPHPIQRQTSCSNNDEIHVNAYGYLPRVQRNGQVKVYFFLVWSIHEEYANECGEHLASILSEEEEQLVAKVSSPFYNEWI